MDEKVDLAEKLALIDEHFRPKIVPGPGELFIVRRGVEHCPRANEEAHVLLIEPLGTANNRGCGRRADRSRRAHLDRRARDVEAQR